MVCFEQVPDRHVMHGRWQDGESSRLSGCAYCQPSASVCSGTSHKNENVAHRPTTTNEVMEFDSLLISVIICDVSSGRLVGRSLRRPARLPLEKVVVRLSEGTEVVGEEIVGRRHAEQREAWGLAQQAAAAGPLAAPGTAHGRHSNTAASSNTVQLFTQLVSCKYFR